MNHNAERSDLDTLIAVIACSQIVVAGSAMAYCPVSGLPDGYGEVEIVVLRWIAAEGRRVARALAPVQLRSM